MAKSDQPKSLADEARTLGIDPATYDLTLDEHVAQLQERVDTRKAEIAAVEGKQSGTKDVMGKGKK